MTLTILQFDQSLRAGKAPEWVHLLPLGDVTARDGRRFVIDDPQPILDRFAAGQIDLPIDYDHQREIAKETRSGPAPAAGWIKQFDLRADGIWGRVDWTDQARDLISERAYRYLSPTLVFNSKTKAVVSLKSAALVHNPALHLTALAHQEDTMGPETNNPGNTLAPRIAQLLGVDLADDPEALLDALKERLNAGASPDPSKYVPIDAVQELMRNLQTNRAETNEARASAKVDDAFQRGFLTTAMKP